MQLNLRQPPTRSSGSLIIQYVKRRQKISIMMFLYKPRITKEEKGENAD